jgi:predicted nucleotidyltransferase
MSSIDVPGALRRIRDEGTPFSRALVDLQTRLKNVEAVVFGGFVRDAVLNRTPYDIDVVVAASGSAGFKKIRERFYDYKIAITGFGGLKLENAEGVKVDLWALSETVALKEQGVTNPTFHDLLKTTFFNVQTVAVDLQDLQTIYSNGFYEAMRDRVLEINYEPNPYPANCVMRTFVMQHLTGFQLGPKLLHYMKLRAEDVRLKDIIRMQKIRHGEVLVSEEQIRRQGFR